jgi:hypothetical protein
VRSWERGPTAFLCIHLWPHSQALESIGDFQYLNLNPCFGIRHLPSRRRRLIIEVGQVCANAQTLHRLIRALCLLRAWAPGEVSGSLCAVDELFPACHSHVHVSLIFTSSCFLQLHTAQYVTQTAHMACVGQFIHHHTSLQPTRKRGFPSLSQNFSLSRSRLCSSTVDTLQYLHAHTL